MRSGAGLTTVAAPASAVPSIAARIMPEIMTFDLPETDGGAISFEAIDEAMNLARRATVVAVGPGLSSEEEPTRRFVRDVIARRATPVVIDADGLMPSRPGPRTCAARGSAARAHAARGRNAAAARRY